MPDQAQYTPAAPGGHRPYAGSGGSYPAPGLPSPPLATYPTPASYNPQQYARTEPQYSAPAYAAAPMASPPLLGHQPYVPAAYQSPHSPPQQYGFPPPLPTAPRPAAVNQPPPQIIPRRGLPPQVPPRPPQYAVAQAAPTSQAPAYAGHTAQPAANGSTSMPSAGYTPPRPPPPPSGSSYYHEEAAPARTQSYDHPSPSPQPNQEPQHQRIPSLPTYSRNDDYATPSPTQPRFGSHAYQPPPNAGSRHPQSRPLPAQPVDESGASSPNSPESGHQFGYDALLQEVEAAVMGRPAPSSDRRGSTPKPERPHLRIEPDENPLFAAHDSAHPSRSNGVGSSLPVNYGAYSSESDAEAAAGLAALQMAEEQEAAEQAYRSARSSGGHPRQSVGHDAQRPSHGPLPPLPPKEASGSDSDRVLVDMDTYGGGPPANVNYHYGQDYGASGMPQRPIHSQTPSSTSVPYSERSNDSFGAPAMDYYMPSAAPSHPIGSMGARTDTGGTGGLSTPSAIRQREDYDEDEATLYDGYEYGSSGATSPAPEGSHSRSSTLVDHNRNRSNSRPLPQVPDRRGAIDYQALSPEQARFGYGAPEVYENAYGTSAAGISKSNSIGNYGQQPVAITPSRSATDAFQRRQGMQITTGSGRPGMYESMLSPEATRSPRDQMGPIVLPSMPAGKRRKFVPSKLSPQDYKRCPEPWALSSILDWLQEMAEGEADLRDQLLIDGLVALFTHKVPTMNVADAESLSAQLVAQMLAEGVIAHEEEWIKFTGIRMNGVIFQLTGAGCYAPKLHNLPAAGRCYSHHCMRTLRKIDLTTQTLGPQGKSEDWMTFYKIKMEDLANFEKKEIERQNNLHEIVTTEDNYLDALTVLLALYRDGLVTSAQPIMSKKRIDDFVKDVFGKVPAVKKANEDYLLAQLKYRQQEQGPWVKGFADIFREWIRKAKDAYIAYASNFPNATLRMRKEAERNVLFRQFLDQMQQNERSRRLGWDTYLKAPITRLQQYSLLLGVVLKHSLVENEEKRNLDRAIEEIKSVTYECDAKVAEMTKRTDLMELASKLKLRPGMNNVQLNLNDLGREILFKGDLQRRGSNKISWVDTHAVLFDHYLVLAKPMQQRDASGGYRSMIYDVSKPPIPMDLLVLESMNDDAVMKSSVKGVTTATSRAPAQQDGRTARAGSNTTGSTNLSGQPPANSALSISSGSSRNMANQTMLDPNNEKILYPFRIKHLGLSESYVLYASTAASRQDWCDKIIDAKTRHASSLFAQNAEPFRIRVLADTAFNYDSTYTSPVNVVIKGTPLDRAIEECDRSFYGTSGTQASPICRAMVNCATSFSPGYGPRMMVVGTDFGVFLSEYSNPRGWVKCPAISLTNVTQIAAIEEFSLFLVLAEKSLIAYNLETVCPPSGGPTSSEARKAPQKLSGNRDVGFFMTGRQKDRTLIFYKKRDGINSTFKVLEPVYQRGGANNRTRFGIRKGNTDFVREFDEFYIPSNCYGMNIFEKSLAVSTERGFEVLTLEKKQSFSIPDLRDPAVAEIAAQMKDQKPLGMFRINENEFLLVFATLAVYVNKHGVINRVVVMEFVGAAKDAALYNNTFLVLVDKSGEFVEVRNAINGRLRQVVSGRDVRLLDNDDGGHGGTIKVCMQHPERERVQLVVELIVNEGLKEFESSGLS